jgi:hypothetical protein
MMAAVTMVTKTAAEGAFYRVGGLHAYLPIHLTFQRVNAYEGKKATKIRGYAVKARKRLCEILFRAPTALLRFYVLPPYFTRLRAFVWAKYMKSLVNRKACLKATRKEEGTLPR